MGSGASSRLTSKTVAQSFQQALQASIEGLHLLAGQARKTGRKSTAASVDNALKLLGQEADLRDLVAMYHNALFQG